MALGSFCKELGIDEGSLSGEKQVTSDVKNLTNGVMLELQKYKTAKKFSTKDLSGWIIKIFHLNCKNTDTLQKELDTKFESLISLKRLLSKPSKLYKGEVERLLKWPFELPSEASIDPVPKFEPATRASLGPKLLKVLKEKAGDDEDLVDISGASDDDNEMKKKKAREEIIQLKKDLMSARKIITSLNDQLNDLNSKCALLDDMSKSSVSERRRIEKEVCKLKTEWSSVIKSWHNCIERLNFVNNNKGNYLDAGYMLRRNKTKQGIFDELNYEFERTVDNFKETVLRFEMERRKKGSPRDFRRKGKLDRKRQREETADDIDSGKILCLSDQSDKPIATALSVEDFVRCEKVEDFKGGKFINALKAIYNSLISLPIPVCNVPGIIYSVLGELENINTDKISFQAFAGNILMEAQMLATLQTFSDLIQKSKVNIFNDSSSAFTFSNGTYDVTLPDKTHIVLGVRNIYNGSPDTSLDILRDILYDFIDMKTDGSNVLQSLIDTTKKFVVDYHLLGKRIVEIIFLCKQQLLPKLKTSLDILPETFKNKIFTLNNFNTGLYFLLGLAELTDITILVWELLVQNMSANESKTCNSTSILSSTLRSIYSFCEWAYPEEETDNEFFEYLKLEKKIDGSPLSPHKDNIFNTAFHNSAGLWFFHETECLNEFKKNSDQMQSTLDIVGEKNCLSVARALGLIGKLVAVPLWTVLEDCENIEVGIKYCTLLKKIESWSKDASQFMKGVDKLFDDVPVSHDAVYISLIKSNANDILTKELLELIFTSFIPYVKCFLYSEEEEIKDTKMEIMEVDVIPSIHENFSVFDRVTKIMHLAPTYALDSVMSYNKARNGEWQEKICTKNDGKVFELIKMNSSKQLKCVYKRKIDLNDLKRVAEGEPDADSKYQGVEKKYKLIDDIVKCGGLWKSEKEIDDQLGDMKESDRKNALKAQIQFRRSILGEINQNGLLDLAHEGECFSAEKLTENLKAIIKKEFLHTETDIFELSSASDDMQFRETVYELCQKAQEKEGITESSKNFATKENFQWLLGKLINHVWTVGDHEESLTGVCIARKKANGVYSYFIRYKENSGVYKFTENKIAEDYRNGKLCVINPLPKELVGSKLNRAFFKDDGELEWHDCKVVDIITSGENPEFAIEYDIYGDISDIISDKNHIPELESLTFSSHLLDDYKTDRLRLL